MYCVKLPQASIIENRELKAMKKEKRDPLGQELLREMIGIYKPQSIKEIQDMLKDMFSGTMEDMLKAELDTEPGYKKNNQQPKETPNRRNGRLPQNRPVQLRRNRAADTARPQQ